jgi:hypothetical protein
MRYRFIDRREPCQNMIAAPYRYLGLKTDLTADAAIPCTAHEFTVSIP